MRCFGLVPVKRLDSAKSRLRPAVADRPALALAMLETVLLAMAGSGALEDLCVVSPDPRVREACREAEFLLQDGLGLNRALEQGRRRALGLGAESLLVVLADLPDLTPEAVRLLLASAPEVPGAVAAPDRAGTGTNALLQAPADLLPFRFGRGSLRRHAEETARVGVPLVLHRAPETMLDLDTPIDLQEIRFR